MEKVIVLKNVSNFNGKKCSSTLQNGFARLQAKKEIRMAKLHGYKITKFVSEKPLRVLKGQISLF